MYTIMWVISVFEADEPDDYVVQKHGYSIPIHYFDLVSIIKCRTN